MAVDDEGEADAQRWFSLDEAHRLVEAVVPEIDELVRVRAALTAGAHARRSGDDDVALADLKGWEARLAEILDGFAARGIHVKGWAPVLLDVPARVGDRDVLLCLLEGDRELAWFHDAEHGFAGRRPLRELLR